MSKLTVSSASRIVLRIVMKQKRLLKKAMLMAVKESHGQTKVRMKSMYIEE